MEPLDQYIMSPVNNQDEEIDQDQDQDDHDDLKLSQTQHLKSNNKYYFSFKNLKSKESQSPTNPKDIDNQQLINKYSPKNNSIQQYMSVNSGDSRGSEGVQSPAS